MRTWLSIGCVVLLAGCTAVTMQEPFPETPLTEEEQEQFEGVWQIDETVVNIAFTTNGVPWMAMVDWDDGDFQLLKYRLHFTKHNNTRYVCMPGEPGEPLHLLSVYDQIFQTLREKNLSEIHPIVRS